MNLIEKIKKMFEPEMIDYPKDYQWMFNYSDKSLKIDAIKHCKEFYALKKTKQSTVWHKEGNAWNHTMLVYNAMCSILEDDRFKSDFISRFTERDILIMKLAALCHDLGKATTTYWDENEQNWKCKSHGEAGEKITREILYDADLSLREEVCWLVRWHMEFHHFLEKPTEKKIAVLRKLDNGMSTIEKLLLLNIADCMGSKSTEVINVEDRYQKIRRFTINNLGLEHYENTGFKEPVEKTDLFTVYIMIGLPGSGKDTYIENNLKDCEVICFDDIREEVFDGHITHRRKLVLDKNEENKVKNIAIKRIKECCEKKHSFVINHTSLRKKRREAFMKYVEETGAHPRFVYVLMEASSLNKCIMRRLYDGKKWKRVIKEMFTQFEYPYYSEAYDKLIYERT